MKETTKNTILDISCGLLVLLFAYTAIDKFLQHAGFVRVLENSPLLKSVSVVASWGIPVVETVIVILLLVPRFRSTGLLASWILLAIFTIYITGMYFFAPSLPCSCGGIISKMGWGTHIIFNLMMMAIAYVGWCSSKSNQDFTAINRKSRIPV